MKVAIDCADLDHSRIDGTRVYIKNVLNWMGRINSQDQFFLFHQKEFNPMLIPQKFQNYFDEKIPYKYWWTQTRFAYELRQLNPEVCWMPIQQMPYLANKKQTKFVVTIHDLAFKIFPQHFTKSDKFRLNLFTDYAVKNADKIIAVSHSTKKDILRFYPKIREDKITVVYHGVNVGKIQITKSKLQINNKFQNLNCRYVLYVGAIQPRKDLITLIKAFEVLKQKKTLGPPLKNGKVDKGNLKLVIAGEPAWQAEEILEKIKRSKFSEDIILTGQVSFGEITGLYQNAEVFILPSLYEGFGMPILEAWALKVPVIVADNSSLKEIGAEAVLKFETKDKQDLAEKIGKILKDDKIKEDLINRGTERIRNFSWEKCAKKTLEVLLN